MGKQDIIISRKNGNCEVCNEKINYEDYFLIKINFGKKFITLKFELCKIKCHLIMKEIINKAKKEGLTIEMIKNNKDPEKYLN